MADTFNKKEREKKKAQRRKQKQFKREERRENTTENSLENMIAYVDENGVIHDAPVTTPKKEIKAKNIEIGVPRREESEEDSILEGVINFFDESKGYGFIKTQEDENFFVHLNNVTGIPAKGKRVSFEKERGLKGWAAVKVKVEN